VRTRYYEFPRKKKEAVTLGGSPRASRIYGGPLASSQCVLIIDAMGTLTTRGCERRQAPDRRVQTLRAVFYGVCSTRRRACRRGAAKGGYYVDWYGPQLFVSALGIVACCCTDAALTLELLRMGAKEINPVMDSLIHTDLRLFLGVKFLATSLAVVFLVLHKNFRLLNWISVENLVHGFFALYLLLIGYELFLLASR
jgi:hypothetical protein